VREAALEAAREDLNAQKVAMRHFRAAMSKIKASVTEEAKVQYEKIMTDFKRSMAYIG